MTHERTLYKEDFFLERLGQVLPLYLNHLDKQEIYNRLLCFLNGFALECFFSRHCHGAISNEQKLMFAQLKIAKNSNDRFASLLESTLLTNDENTSNNDVSKSYLFKLFFYYKYLKQHPRFTEGVMFLLDKYGGELSQGEIETLRKLSVIPRRQNDSLLIEMLVNHGLVSRGYLLPEALVKQRCESMFDELQPKHRSAITFFQRAFRAKSRLKTHRFRIGPGLTAYPFQVIPPLLKSSEHAGRVLSLIDHLSLRWAVTGTALEHYTTLSNLQSILSTRMIGGHKHLVQSGVNFQPNCLGLVDVQNGDSNSICFTQCLVDPIAICNQNKLRDDLVRLTINSTVLDAHLEAKSSFATKHYQFFKLCDAEAPRFVIHIALTERLTAFVKKRSSHDEVEFGLVFDSNTNIFQKKYSLVDSLFYGNLTQINAFCLLQLFIVIEESSQSLQNKQALLNYLTTLDESVLAKVMVAFAQTISAYSEFNFWAYLPLIDGLIKQVTFMHNESSIDFSHLSGEEYFMAISKLLSPGELEASHENTRNLSSFSFCKQENNPFTLIRLHGILISLSQLESTGLKEHDVTMRQRHYHATFCHNQFNLAESTWDPREGNSRHVFKDYHEIRNITADPPAENTAPGL